MVKKFPLVIAQRDQFVSKNRFMTLLLKELFMFTKVKMKTMNQ